MNGQSFHSIFGAQTCQAMGILVVNDNDRINPLSKKIQSIQPLPLLNDPVLAKFLMVFSNRIGMVPGMYSIHINRSVKLVQHAAWNVAVALRQPLHEELHQLMDQGIIIPVTELTPWTSSMVVVPKKDGSIWVCLDPRELNKAILWEQYPLPTIEDIATHLSGTKIFSVFDVKQGFWHVQLDNASSFLTTFNTPFGRFRWHQMPFGISSAPEVFQRRMHQLVEGLAGVEVITDDFMVYGCGSSHAEAVHDHDTNLHAFLSRCAESNMVLGSHKVQLRQTEVPFIGHVATSHGLKPAHSRVEAILSMPAPTDLQGVCHFLGMVQYLAKFLNQLSDTLQPHCGTC